MDISRAGAKLLSAHKFEPTTVIRIRQADGAKGEFLEARIPSENCRPCEYRPAAQWNGIAGSQTGGLTQTESEREFSAIFRRFPGMPHESIAFSAI
jgi:hypothetical protein